LESNLGDAINFFLAKKMPNSEKKQMENEKQISSGMREIEKKKNGRDSISSFDLSSIPIMKS
jgi:hypothetical protein